MLARGPAPRGGARGIGADDDETRAVESGRRLHQVGPCPDPVPAATSSLLGIFASLEQATVAATKAVEAGASACELLDKTFLAYAASGQPAAAS